MRNYELVLIVHPDLEESAFKDVIDRVTGWITQDGGTVEKLDIWGKRPLAYPIRKKNEGQYVLMHTQINPEFCTTLEQNMRLTEPIMRFLLTSKN